MCKNEQYHEIYIAKHRLLQRFYSSVLDVLKLTTPSSSKTSSLKRNKSINMDILPRVGANEVPSTKQFELMVTL